MTDIVERLRVEAKDWEGNDCTYHDLFTQAAAEIERLRAACQLMIDGKWDRACKAARAALEEMKDG